VAVSITDVARHAGVGTGTVSRVLSGHPSVRPATRARVRASIATLGYRPNALARGLVQGRTRTVGLVVFGLHNPFFGLLTQGVEAAASARGYNVLIADSTGSVERQERAIEMLLERRVDGILVAPIHAEEQELTVIRDAGVRAVLLNSCAGDETVSSVGGDNIRGGLLATAHLLQLGHRRIAFLGHLRSISGCRDRLIGYQQAFDACGATSDPALIIENVPTMDAVVSTVQALLALPDPPTAFVAIKDEYAIAILQTLNEKGLRVPQDVALVGYDDIPVAAWLSCPLTTVAQAKEEQGRVAADLLINQIEDPDTPTQRIILPPRLVVRSSCGAALARTPEPATV
jgi:LacI family transcriptional regulator